jgi:outer membrane receptor for ferrienterochelin and colicins
MERVKTNTGLWRPWFRGRERHAIDAHVAFMTISHVSSSPLVRSRLLSSLLPASRAVARIKVGTGGRAVSLDMDSQRRRRALARLAGATIFLVVYAASVAAQDESAAIRIIVRSAGEAVQGASVVADASSASTDRTGTAALSVSPGTVQITVVKDGYLPAVTVMTVLAGERREQTVELRRLEEDVVVTAARSDTKLRDQPLRVEVIGREEIEEKAMMSPGNVAMLVSETTGLRVQTTAPTLGAANVRIQGLRGRYSQLLADGLPLYGLQGDSLSLLQVPPLDLAQVEVIKGVASALYGSSALGGVVNLVSKRPQTTEHQLLLNATSRTGRDVAAWYAQAPTGNWSWTLLGSYAGQTRRDLDGDGWSDLPSFERGMLRPRIFFDNQRGSSAFATVGVLLEDREGGTQPLHTTPDGRPFVEQVGTHHVDAGFVGRWLMGDRVLSIRGSALRQRQHRIWNDETEDGVRSVSFGEASLQGVSGRHAWVFGGAFQQDRFRLDQFSAFDYRFSAPGVFAQDEIGLGRKWTVGISARADEHSTYGTLASPRLSLLARPRPGWTVRVAMGTGAFAPTPFTEETEETGFSHLLPLQGVRAERARGLSVDVTRIVGPFDITGTVFGSRVDGALQRRIVDSAHVALVNADGPTRTTGTELLIRYRVGELNALFTHGWTRSTEIDPDAGNRRDVPLTPSQFLSFTLVWEAEGSGRLGFEGYYTGRQSLEENPYRSRSRPYAIVGAMGARRVGRVLLFLNCENLLDVRQTTYDPLIRQAPRPDGRWTVDAWAPLDGRVINGGVRLQF